MRSNLKNLMLLAALSALAALTLLPVAAQAQVSQAVQAITPLTRDLGLLKSTTLAGASTVTTADLNGYNVSRVVCVFNMSAHTGTPSTTFKIQNYDVASGKYYDLLTSAAVTSDATPTALYVGPGLTSTTNVSVGLPIAKTWRVSVTIAGTTPAVTSTVGCSVQ